MSKKANERVVISAGELREVMGMSAAEISAELASQGVDADAAVEQLRKLARGMRRKFADKIETEASAPRGVTVALPEFEERVAAGKPAWIGESGAPPKMASILDILGCSSPADAIWARVSGWSMRDVGIRDGDLVLVKINQEAQDGDLVLAHLNGHGQVVKRLRKKDGRVVLQSANPDFADIVVDDPSELRIHGVVMGRAGAL